MWLGRSCLWHGRHPVRQIEGDKPSRWVHLDRRRMRRVRRGYLAPRQWRVCRARLPLLLVLLLLVRRWRLV